MSEKHSPGPSTADVRDAVAILINGSRLSYEENKEPFGVLMDCLEERDKLAADMDAANDRAFRHAEDAGRDSAALSVALADLDAANKRIGELESREAFLDAALAGSLKFTKDAQDMLSRCLGKLDQLRTGIERDLPARIDGAGRGTAG